MREEIKIVEAISSEFVNSSVGNYTRQELYGNYLEGTGSIVFDYVNEVLYACES
jgi:hypothetical protein